MISATEIERLKDPRISLALFGKLMNQRHGQITDYDPHAITHRMQADMLSYIGNPPTIKIGEPEDENFREQTIWTNWLKPRQTGASTTIEMGGLPRAMYTPGYDFLCIADTDKRAAYLHARAHITYSKWPKEYRVPQPKKGESLALTFNHGQDQASSKMRTLSGRSSAAGIGQSPDFLHLSEAAFHVDLASQWTMMQPALLNRDHSMVMVECTPAPLNEPSAEWWKDHFFDGLRGKGRFRSAFYPFWDGKLNARVWDKLVSPSNEEIRLIERYGEQGLALDHLWFRRMVMENDKEIRKNPDLFDVFYPFNFVDCWLATGKSVIPSRALDKYKNIELTPSEIHDYTEFLAPNPNAVYVIGADPAGFGRDHSSFQVLEVWDDGWAQAAEFGGEVDSLAYGEKLEWAGRRFNDAIIAPERNGVGLGAIDYLRRSGYPRLYYDRRNKPGIWKHSHEQMMAALIPALLDMLELHGSDTVRQLGSYGGDKMLERPQASQILHGTGAGRRSRHHWDKVSALALACIAAKTAPRRYRARSASGEDETSGITTFDDWEKYIAETAEIPKSDRKYLVRRRKR